MSVTGWKKKKKIRKVAGIAGIMGVPCLLLMVFLGGLCADLSKQLKEYKDAEKELVTRNGFVLKQDKKTGEEITLSDLVQVKIVGEAKIGICSGKEEDYIGKCCKTNLAAGSLLVEEVLALPETFSQDMRRQTFSDIICGGFISRGDRVDIRISFPTGEDYVVLGKKEVLDTGGIEGAEEEPALTFLLGEEELLRISSAFIDMESYPGTFLYAIPYVDSFQEQAYITYPINRQVFSLMGWDPNVVAASDVNADFYNREQSLRQELEKNLAEILDIERTEMLSETKESSMAQDGYEEKVEFFP